MERPRPRAVAVVDIWKEDLADEEERVDLAEEEVARVFEEDTEPMKNGHTVPLRLRCSSKGSSAESHSFKERLQYRQVAESSPGC